MFHRFSVRKLLSHLLLTTLISSSFTSLVNADTGLPDLVVNNVQLFEAGSGGAEISPIPGLGELADADPSAYYFMYTFGNTGDTDAESTADGYNAIYGDGVELVTYSWQTFFGDVSYLQAGNSRSNEATDINNGSAITAEQLQSYTQLSFCMDSTNVVVESDDGLGSNCTIIENPFYVDPAGPLPDLTVDNILVDPSDYSLDIAILNGVEADISSEINAVLALTITNSDGESPVLTYDLNDFITEDADYHFAGSTMVVSLPGGEEIATYCETATVEESTWTFSAELDYEDAVEESDEYNNSLESTFDICNHEEESPLADLTVDISPSEENPGYMHYTVENLGGFVSESASPTITIVENADFYESLEEALAAGITYGLDDFDSLYRFPAGVTEFELPLGDLSAQVVFVYVDADYQVEESDEENNSDVYISEESEESSEDLPDLVISSVTLNSDHTLHFVVENTGTADVNEELFPVVNLYDLTNGDGSAVEVVNLPEDSGSYRVAGGQVEFNSTYVLPGSGDVSILATVDGNGDVLELSEENDYRATFTIQTQSSGGSGGGSHHNHHSSSSDSSSSSSDSTVEGSEDVTLTSDEEAACGEMTFEDVDENTVGYEAIYRLWCEGVIHGRDATHFAPTDSIKRDEVSKITARLFGYVTTPHGELPTMTGSYYDDLAMDEPLGYYVELLTEQGFFESEMGSRTFRPHDDVTYLEVIELLEELSGQDVSMDGYENGDSVERGSFVDLILSIFE